MNLENISPDSGKNVYIYTNSKVCSMCRGQCCKTVAGIYAPEDFKFKITSSFIIHLLLTKMFSIESVGEGSQSDYFLRPRHIEEDPINPSHYGGVCINWNGDTGCLLNEVERPYQCRMLIPLANGGSYCKHKESDKSLKTDMVQRWDIYKKELMYARANFLKVSKSIMYSYNFDKDGRCDIYEEVEYKIDQIDKIISSLKS